MSRISKAFENKDAFISFVTAGDPNLEATEKFILEMEMAGSSLIEIGIPFSDPIAEGDVIQKANIRALSLGTTTKKVFEMVKSVRKKTNIPLVFLTYINPVFVYGYERFFCECRECGIDGIIIPDLPYEERDELLEVVNNFGVDLITLIAPTSRNRIRSLAKDAKGFIYLVSSMGVTGVRKEIKTDLTSIINEIREVSNTPIAVGFGISEKSQVNNILKEADGVIVGSAIVRIIEENGEDSLEKIYNYISELRG